VIQRFCHMVTPAGASTTGVVFVLRARLVFVGAPGVAHAGDGSLDLAYHNVGVSFGNSKQFTGLRFNLMDRDVQQINGLNVTLFKPGKSPAGSINGISLALIGADAAALNGLNVGVIGLAADV